MTGVPALAAATTGVRKIPMPITRLTTIILRSNKFNCFLLIDGRFEDNLFVLLLSFPNPADEKKPPTAADGPRPCTVHRCPAVASGGFSDRLIGHAADDPGRRESLCAKP